MSTITSIQAQKRKGRYNIFIDGQYRFPVSEEVLINFQLHKGQEITKEEIEGITNAEKVSKAYNQALNYLSYQLRTEKEIIDYLYKKDFSDYEIEPTLKKLREQKLINDLEYAKSYTRTMAKTSEKGPKVIQQQLRKKGILENDIDTALLQFTLENQLENVIHLINKLAQKYRNEAFKNKIQKIKKSLLVKGFSTDVINDALTRVNLEKDNSNEQIQLQKNGEKLFNRYRKYSSLERNQKVKAALYRKGFNIDDINHFIDEHQNLE